MSGSERTATDEPVPPDVLVLLPHFVDGEEPEQDLEAEILVAYLRQHGLAVVLVDAQVSRLAPANLARSVLEQRPGVMCWRVATRPDFRALIEAAPTIASAPNRPLMLGLGDLAARNDRTVLERVAVLDAVVRGEPEATVAAFAFARRDGERWHELAGLTVRDRGSPHRNAPRPPLEDLAALPRAADDLFDTERQSQSILISRGCNQDCLYCGLQVPYRKGEPGRKTFWRGRPAKDIVDEIEHYNRRGVDRFSFNSFVLLGEDEHGTEQIRAVAEEIIRRGLRIHFSFVTQAGALYRNRALLPRLREAGLAQLTLGIDSGVARFHSEYRLPFGRTEIRGALAALHESEITFVPTFIFYDPRTTLAEIRDNLAFLESLAPWFSHLPATFAYLLDQHLINTMLRVRAEMPIYANLRTEGLATEVDPLEADPAIGFRSSATGRCFRLHQRANQVICRRIRLLLFSPQIVNQFPHLDRFPLRLLERIAAHAEQEATEEEALRDLNGWTRAKLADDLETMLDLVDLPAEHRHVFAPFQTTPMSAGAAR